MFAAVLFLAAHAQAGQLVEVTVTGEVEFNQIGDPPLGDVLPGDAATLTFVVDSDDFADSPNFPTRGYAIDPSSFSLTLGSTVIGLADPFPPAETPYFVIRNDDPAVDGFFTSTNIDFPFGVPLDQVGIFTDFLNNTSLTYTVDTLDSLDILDALGTYDFTGLTVFNWTIDDGPFNAMGLVFEQMTISGCPLSDFEECVLNQSGDTGTIQDGNTLACAAGGNTTQNGWARCFDLSAEGATGPVTVASVTFGVEQATTDDIDVNVNLYLDGNGCGVGPNAPGDDAMLVASEALLVDIADVGTFLTVPITAAPVVGPGDHLWVEIEQVVDGTTDPFFGFRPAGNDAGQCAPSYIRAEDCGVPAWTDLAALGFPAHNLILTVDLTGCTGQAIEASVDIKPGSCPNSYNRSSRGVLPVAILGTGDFDVTQIDLESVVISRADGMGGAIGPNEGPPGPHSEFEDVGTPFEAAPSKRNSVGPHSPAATACGWCRRARRPTCSRSRPTRRAPGSTWHRWTSSSTAAASVSSSAPIPRTPRRC
jgi:hypothetical protein